MKKGFGNILEFIDAFQDMIEKKFDYSDFTDYHVRGYRFPRTRVSKNENDIQLIAELPGVKKEDLKLEIKSDEFTLSGKKSNPLDPGVDSEEPKVKKFKKTIRLSCEVDTDKIDAKYENGVLFVTLPIKESEKSRNITIN